MSRLTLAAFAAAGLALAGCAWGPGGGFATLQKAVTTQALPLAADRLDEAGRWKTDNGYRLAVAEKLVRVQVAAVTIEAAGTTAASAAAFDPANPPPGYSLCHGGHCHRDDGALIDYADIPTGAAAAAPPRTLMVLTPTSKTAFVPLGGQAVLDSFYCRGLDGACALDQGTPDAATLRVEALQAYGQATAGPGLPALGTGTVDWVLDLEQFAQPVAFKGGLGGVAIGRTGPAGLRLTGRLQVTERLFDGIQWARLAETAAGATIRLDADAATREQLLANLTRSQWMAELTP